jgi:hypothetical protein
MSVILSCLSSLFVVVTVTPGALMPTLNKIFESITFGSQRHAGIMNGGGAGNAATVPNDVKLLRRHGCCLLVPTLYNFFTSPLTVTDI